MRLLEGRVEKLQCHQIKASLNLDILITGGAGFIGTALSRQLSEIGISVTILDLPGQIQKVAIPGVKILTADISSFPALENLSLGKFEYVFHLASQTSSLISQEDPTSDVDTNVRGTLNICRIAERIGAKLIFTSSMAVYGDQEDPIDEGCQPNPRSNYGASKISAETYIKMFGSRGLRYTIFRLFNVYGPGQDLENMKQGMLSIFVSQLLKTNRIDVTGSFDRFRDFIYVDDVVEALLTGLSKPSDQQIYNVGTGDKTTVRSLIDMIIRYAEASDVTVKNIGSFNEDQFGTFSNSEKLRSTGWIPKTNLPEGIKKTLEDARQVLG